jgi:methanogenic corrinoid protein MtbC1
MNLSNINELEKALISANRLHAREVVSNYSKTHTPFELVEELLSPVMEHIGQGWEDGKFALSQVYMSGQICAEIAKSLNWKKEERPQSTARIAIVVLEDYHLLGKQMVHSALQASGFDLLDYGRQDLDGLIEKVKEDAVEILLVSTLMLRSALRVEQLRKRLTEEKLQIKLIVGGAPFRFDRELWKKVGADAMGLNTAEALQIVKRLL